MFGRSIRGIAFASAALAGPAVQKRTATPSLGLGILVASCVVLAPSRALADDVALFVHESTASAADASTVRAALSSVVGEAGNAAVWLSNAEARARADAALDSVACPETCMSELATSLGVEEIFGVTIWAREGQDGGELAFGFRRIHGAPHVLSVEVASFERTAILPAAQNAYFQLRRWDQGHAPFLRVVTVPEGAAIIVRGQPRGRSPLEIPAPPGPLRVVVSLEGYRTVHRTVEIPREGEALLELALAPSGGGAASLSAASRGARPAPTARRSGVGPAILALAGAAGIATSFGLQVVDRCASHDSRGICLARTRGNMEHAAVYGGLSAAALLGGVIWGVQVRRQNARRLDIGVHATGLRLRGAF